MSLVSGTKSVRSFNTMAGVVCGAVGDVMCPEDRPSPIFTTFGCLINGIAGIWAVVALAEIGRASCRERVFEAV